MPRSRVVLWSAEAAREEYSAKFRGTAVRALEAVPGSRDLFLAGLALRGGSAQQLLLLDPREPAPKDASGAAQNLHVALSRPTQILAARASTCGNYVASTNQDSAFLLWDLRAARGASADGVAPHQEISSLSACSRRQMGP